jgi:hypothetical protein
MRMGIRRGRELSAAANQAGWDEALARLSALLE